METEDFAKIVTDSIGSMLAYWDIHEICRFANRAYVDWFGRTPEEMIDKISMRELLGPLYEKNLPYIKEAQKGNFQEFEREIPLPNGNIRFSLATYTPHIVNGEVRGFIANVTDISTEKMLQSQIEAAKIAAEYQASHDFLTNLYNRAFITDFAEKMLAQRDLPGKALSLCLMDLDGFKQINDTLGHEAGDEVLRRVAHILIDSLRTGDVCARLGGDEFIAVLNRVGSNGDSSQICNRIIGLVNNVSDIDGKPVSLGASFGVAHFPIHGRDFASLLKNADAALYCSKKLGKNRVSIFSSAGTCRDEPHL